MLAVTGINGHSGRHFLERVRETGEPLPIRVLARETSDLSFLADYRDLPIEVVRVDLDDVPGLTSALAGVDTVLHIAGIQRSPAVFRAAVDAGASWFVAVHTTGRFSKYRDAASDYIATEDEILARTEPIAVTILRPTMIYGSSRDRNMYQLIDYLARHRVFPVFGSGRNLMQPVLARDLGRAYHDVLMHPDVTRNKVYDLSGATVLSYSDVLRTIASELHRRVRFVHVPLGLSVAAARLYAGLSPRPRISVEQVLRMNEDKAFPHDDATRDFGFAPATFEEGIRMEIAEYLAERGGLRA
jgi:uncharacterized protein YbjT (DUF2867 family)